MVTTLATTGDGSAPHEASFPHHETFRFPLDWCLCGGTRKRQPSIEAARRNARAAFLWIERLTLERGLATTSVLESR